MDWGKYKNFSADEFKCSHCGANEMKEEYMNRLQMLRTAYNKPMKVTSGYRCPKHPIEAAKPSPGPHSTGRASDIAVQGADAHRLLQLALELGFTGIGVQQKGASRFLHLDDIENTQSSPRPTVWSY